MTDLVSSQFVSPSPRSELNGEFGLTLREICASIQVEYSEALKTLPFLKKNGLVRKTVKGEHFLTLRKAIEYMELGKKINEQHPNLETYPQNTSVFVRL